MYTREEIDIITLCSFEELTYKTKYVLLDGLQSMRPDFVKFENMLIKSLSAGVYNKVKGRYFSEEYRKRILQSLEKRKIICVTYASPDYPEYLRQTPFPPITLYCKGNAKLLKTRCFSVVGSRVTAANVIKECKKISGQLTRHFTVVTGMADGADSAAAEGALESGKIIGVLAYGFDFTYPAFNGELMKKVEEKGLLITEHTPQIAPKAYLFPVRNRIIAGLSEGTLVVSAGEKSGALITAEYAAEYGRHVFVFPYNIGVATGAGCNSLIKKGGLLTENILDIFSAFGLDFKEPEKEELTEAESELFALISAEGEIFVPEAAEKIGKMPFQLIPVLTSLEVKGLIVRLGGNRYAAV